MARIVHLPYMPCHAANAKPERGQALGVAKGRGLAYMRAIHTADMGGLSGEKSLKVHRLKHPLLSPCRG